ncbi:CAAD domain-containing protein [Anabaena sp. PCC 7108]|uniref:CAAD domain-containing protein n=1 Tax=Anabaena sp. PCC 7108 TaxID=163908 RepID=UPI001ED9B859|nr:CAAD domain-containing protein [Anabaena sp. PCC 7108]
MANIMETQQQQPGSANSVSSQDFLALEGAEAANLPKLPPAKEPEAQWQRINRQIFDFLAQLPDYLGSFLNQNKQALLTVVLILSALVTVKVALAILDAIDDVPLLAPIFEIIGLVYAIWFTFRYLIKAETRQELSQKVSLLKQQL